MDIQYLFGTQYKFTEYGTFTVYCNRQNSYGYRKRLKIKNVNNTLFLRKWSSM